MDHEKTSLFKVLGGFLGFLVGVLGGGYLGLIIGGTFLGGLELHQRIGIEAYELTTYIGAIIGALILPIFGVKYAQKFSSPNKN